MAFLWIISSLEAIAAIVPIVTFVRFTSVNLLSIKSKGSSFLIDSPLLNFFGDPTTSSSIDDDDCSRPIELEKYNRRLMVHYIGVNFYPTRVNFIAK